jgi:hypothetical protein
MSDTKDKKELSHVNQEINCIEMVPTYKSPVRFVLIDAAPKAGQTEEPCSDRQFA